MSEKIINSNSYHQDAPAWKVELKSALSAGGETKINVDIMLGKAVEMFPR